MPNAESVSVGDKVTFKGFSEELEDNPPLVAGEQYQVEAIGEDKDGAFYTVHIEDNGEIVAVDIYNDEIVYPEDESAGEAIGFADVVKGDNLTVSDVGGNTYEGEVFKKTKTLLGIRHDGTEITVRAKDITEIARAAEVIVTKEEVTEDEAEAPKPKKAATKKKVAKKKATAKKKVAAKKVAAKKTTAKKTAAKKVAAPAPKQDEVDEDLKGLIILERGEEDADILEMVEGTEDLLGLAQEMAEEAANMEYQLGGILYHVRVSKAYKDLKPAYAEKGGFALYTETELGIHYRKCMYLIDIYSVWNKYGLDKQWISDHGWSKALLVAKNVDEENADALMGAAEEQSVADLRETIKESFSKKGADNREIVKKMTFKFRLMEEPASLITDYLEMAMKQLGLDRPEQAFEHIVTEWATEHLDVSKTRRRARTDTLDEQEAKPVKKATAKPKARKKKAVKASA